MIRGLDLKGHTNQGIRRKRAMEITGIDNDRARSIRGKTANLFVISLDCNSERMSNLGVSRAFAIKYAALKFLSEYVQTLPRRKIVSSRGKEFAHDGFRVQP